MKTLVFSTGNTHKFVTAKHTCAQYGIKLLQEKLDITEIQERSPEKVARDKATKAFAAIGQPVVISDDSWAFSGLRGFPGVYMHSINEWFTAEDYLRLLAPIKNREVICTQYLIYSDKSEQKVFQRQTKGVLLKEIRGTSPHSSHTIIALAGDNGLSVAEAYIQSVDKSIRSTAKIWHELAVWFNAR